MGSVGGRSCARRATLAGPDGLEAAAAAATAAALPTSDAYTAASNNE